MDFAAALETVSRFLDGKELRYAVIGGVALAAYGLPRTTLDLDFVVDGEAQEALVLSWSLSASRLPPLSRLLEHLHPDPAWGRLDFAYVRGDQPEALRGLPRAAWPRGQDDPGPEAGAPRRDEILAFRNDPARTFQDMADIRFLLTLPGVDRAEIRGSFKRHGLEERFHEIERTL